MVDASATQRVALAVPTTYMNESGARRARAGERFGIDGPDRLVIVHDELDLPPGTVRVKAGGGIAGHNGLRSIPTHLHTTDFVRVRIGVGKPPSAARGAAHVLKRPPQADRELLATSVEIGRRRGRAHRGRRHRRRHGVVPLAAHLTDDRARAHRRAAPPNPPRRQPGRRPAPAAHRPGDRRGRSGPADATVAVPEAAQAVVVAGLATFTRAVARCWWSRPPGSTPSAWPDDLACLLAPEGDPADRRGRSAPSAGRSPCCRRGRPCPSSGSAPSRDDGPAPGRAVAPAGAPTATLPAPPAGGRGAGPRPAPAARPRDGHGARSSIRPGQHVDDGALLADLVARGYRREHQVEHRGEFAVRGGIVDVFPSTADVPVRIDLWGDEVDRLTAFDVGDQRSVPDLDAVALFGCRELVLTAEVRRGRGVAGRRGGRGGVGQWERLADGEQFDGMESWLPVARAHASGSCPTCSARAAQVVLVEPRRIRDRAAELLDEEAALAETLAATWGAKEADGGHLPAPPRALRPPAARLRGRRRRLPTVPEGPSTTAR